MPKRDLAVAVFIIGVWAVLLVTLVYFWVLANGSPSQAL